jgi:hypothetical protein
MRAKAGKRRVSTHVFQSAQREIDVGCRKFETTAIEEIFRLLRRNSLALA